MTSMAKTAGAVRILPSGKIPHPVGDPTRSHDEESAWRQDVIRKALHALEAKIEEATVFA
jgi:betaine reductase